MAQRTFHLDEVAANALLAAYQATNDGAYRTRLQAVRLYGLGYTPVAIAEITGAPRSSLMLWCRTYRQGGLSALDDKRVGGNSRKLNAAQIDALGRTLRRYTPRSRFGPQAATQDSLAWTVADLKRLVADDYDVSYQSVVSYYTLFKRCNFSYHQPSATFRSRNEAAVVEWETQLEKN
jgi:transposase